MLTSTMVACGTRPPSGSSTVPRIAPVAAFWARAVVTTINNSSKDEKRVRRAQFEPRDIGSPPVVENRLGGQTQGRYRTPVGSKMRRRAGLRMKQRMAGRLLREKGEPRFLYSMGGAGRSVRARRIF